MSKEVVLIFDIGKTNKKFFLFDKDFKEVYREHTRIAEIQDEDGYPCENLAALEAWLIEVYNRLLLADKYRIRVLNFSAYGASFVHLDNHGNVLTPLYHYPTPSAG